MAERLEQIANRANAQQNVFLSEQRVELGRKALAKATDPRVRFQMESRLALDLLNSGRSAEAAQAYGKFEGTLQSLGLFEQNKHLLRMYQALAYLRLGEQENCQDRHTIDSCLLPIQGSGVHRLPRGSRGAITVLSEVLKEEPADLSARWLLNIAYMTLGEYPAGVPAAWLIPPEVFASECEFPRFTDVAGKVGLDTDGLAGGSVVDDFDGDGYLDVMFTSIGLRDQMRYFRNRGDGGFVDQTEAAGLTGEWGGLNLIQGDYNNDGHVDVFVLRGAWFGPEGRHPNSLLRNNGNGTFEDVTEEAGLLSFHPTQTAVWFDFNRDGWLDLFIGNETHGSERHRPELYRNDGTGRFIECATKSGVVFTGLLKSVVSGDYDNDGWPDLYLSFLDRANVLLRNEGAADGTGQGWKFGDVTARAGVAEPVHSFVSWFWDYNNDGALDLFVAGYNIQSVGDVAADYLGLPHGAERARLYRNNGDGTFTDATKAAGLHRVLHAMGANFGDLDSDGNLDFYVGTGNPDLITLIPNRMFRNVEGQKFLEVTSAGGFGHLQKGHGVSFGDLDNDGDQDVFEDMGGAYTGDRYRNVLFENPGHTNHWIALDLVGREKRPALGARIEVVIATQGGERSIYRRVSSGGSFGASPLRQAIGLGAAERILRIEVVWPGSLERQRFSGMLMDRFYWLRQGEQELERRELKHFRLGAGLEGAVHPHQH